MRFAVQARLRGETWLLAYTEAETPERARSLLECAIVARRALLHPMAELEIVPVNEPPTNEDR